MKKKFKLFRAYVADNWKFALPFILAVGMLGFLLVFKLGSLVGGLSLTESMNQQLVTHNRIGLEAIVREPIFLPYTFMMYLLQFTPFSGPTAIRSIGVIFGALSVFGMFYIFKKWHTARVAILGTILFATTSWFLHTARLADPAASYLLIPLLVAAMIALQSKARSRFAILLAVLFGLGMLYIPGVIWFLLPAVIIKRKLIRKALRLQPIWFKVGLGFIALVMLLPLVAMIAKPIPGKATALDNSMTLLGFPGDDIASATEMFRHLGDNISGIFAYSFAGPLYTPGHLPWFDIGTTVLILLGAIQFIVHWRLDRSKLIAILGALSLVLIAFKGPVSSVILLPFLFLFAVEGLRWFLDRWLSVFPRNPFARGFAVVMVTVLVGSIVTYHLNRYFFAWGRSPDTHAVFDKRP